MYEWLASYVLTVSDLRNLYGQHDNSIYGKGEREIMKRKQEEMGKMDREKGTCVE